MLGITVLCLFMLAGVATVWSMLPRQSAAIRAYLGLALGFVMMMWLPSLCAFFMGFTRGAQYVALGLAVFAAAGAWIYRMKRPADEVRDAVRDEHPPLGLTLLLLIPFLAIGGYLLHTHTLREVDGALHVGQSTFGDLSLHLGIATGLRGAGYPPEYTLLPGTLLGYPFLADAAAASMLMLGTSLRWSFILTGFAMMGLTYWGFVILAWTFTRSRRATAFAFLLLFLNGGLGFVYMLDGLPSDPSRFLEIFTGFYLTPTNIPDLNLRWSNVLCDMMVPQRTLLAGWMMVIPAILLLYHALKTRRRSVFVAVGVWAGLMPMVHTHSFLALGLISFGAMVYTLRKSAPGAHKQVLLNFVLYGGIAAALALPQLLLWTLPQSLGGNSLKFQFNWVNWNESGGGLIDGYFWFWIKNVGLIYLLMVPAALRAGKNRRALALGALCVYVVAELFLFQPNPYDNNKLFYVAFMLMAPLCAGLLVEIYDRLKGIPGRSLLAGVFVTVSLLSGALTLGRELVSDYQLFSAGETEAARYIDQNAPERATFATGTQHNNPVAALAGRNLVCGTPTFLYYHGVDYSRQQSAVRGMMQNPRENLQLFEEYHVDFVYVSSYERGEFRPDERALSELFELWFDNGEVTIYRVTAGVPVEAATF